MQPLLITSFTGPMYRVSGVHLLRSYLRYAKQVSLLVCTEKCRIDAFIRCSPKALTYELSGSAFLQDWLHENRDIIPQDLGGTARPCACPQADDPFGNHKVGCHWAWFNKNASRWFRKIAVLQYAANAFPSVDALIWIDSDCRFVGPVLPQDIEEWFSKRSMFYLKGPDREIIESGVIGFRLDGEGRAVLDEIFERYRLGTFRKDLRWDDGYQFTLSIDRRLGAAADLASKQIGDGHVVPLSRLSRFITHSKGIHKYSKVMR